MSFVDSTFLNRTADNKIKVSRATNSFDYIISQFEAEYQAAVTLAQSLGYVLPSSAIQAAQNKFVYDLKQAGLFSRMKSGYFFHSGSKEFGTINIKDSTKYRLSIVNNGGGIIFGEGFGCKSDNLAYFVQPFKMNEYAGIESNFTVCQYVSESNTVDTGNRFTHGVFDTTTFAIWGLRPLGFGGVSSFGYSPNALFVANTDHKGLYVQTKSGATDIIYKNGVISTAVNNPIAPTVSANRSILCRDAGVGNYLQYLACDFIFDKFTIADELAFRTAFNTYKASVSLP